MPGAALETIPPRCCDRRSTPAPRLLAYVRVGTLTASFCDLRNECEIVLKNDPSCALRVTLGSARRTDRQLPLPKALQVLRHLAREWQVLGVEPLYLLNARAGILGEVEDVDLAL
jgi:hypothetical protein